MILDFKNEDALTYVKSLPSASIDLVLTDPPYAISRETNFNKIAERVDLSSTPVSKVLSTLFTKEKVRTDWVKKKDLHNFKDC